MFSFISVSFCAVAKVPKEWVVKMAADVSRSPSEIKHLGDEWSDDKSIVQVLEDFVFPFLSNEACVAEIGSGGGRLASIVAPRVRRLECFDISVDMLKLCREALNKHDPPLMNTGFTLLSGDDCEFPPRFHGAFDLVYSLDVFPHLDLHTMFAYFRSMTSILKPGGAIAISTANLAAPLGFDRFAKQRKYSAGGFYFVTPDMIELLAHRTGWKIVKKSHPSLSTADSPMSEAPVASFTGENIYYNRDFVCLMQRRE